MMQSHIGWPKYMVSKNGRYYWEPSKKLRDVGLVSEPLGYDLSAAIRLGELKNLEIEQLFQNTKRRIAQRTVIQSINLEYARQLYDRAKWRASFRKIGFHITLEEFDGICKRSNGRCEVSHIPFVLDEHKGSKFAFYKPSLDRINSRRPYTFQNCRIVCAVVNLALGHWGEEVLMLIAKGMVLGKNAVAKQISTDLKWPLPEPQKEGE